ncbi:MAG: 23S rRNA (adenine(2030)-N(6))-methyltransferase RlmJ [Salinarimonadaceae bacterium]|nr:MAG: 23S rRNA (adenine(2030)-N(6))-methyltransferase RlmJ [Salinarimonadaceae bacterium]
MNYRHAFHAGNFADVMKHLVLTRIVAHLLRKETPFRAIDTHAGIGLYDLCASEAARTGEWRDGIARLDAPFAPEAEAVLAAYRAVLAEVRERHGDMAYPGSPAILREMLRPIDRGVFVELHPDDYAVLAERYNEVANLKALRLDAWQALRAMIPPREKRGLVLIDPPYEVPDELERVVAELRAAVAKWPTGIYATWYPIKDARAIERAFAPLGDLPRPALRIETTIARPDGSGRLVGSGLIVVNPPWTLREEMEAVLPALAERLAQGDYAGYRCDAIGAPA